MVSKCDKILTDNTILHELWQKMDTESRVVPRKAYEDFIELAKEDLALARECTEPEDDEDYKKSKQSIDNIRWVHRIMSRRKLAKGYKYGWDKDEQKFRKKMKKGEEVLVFPTEELRADVYEIDMNTAINSLHNIVFNSVVGQQFGGCFVANKPFDNFAQAYCMGARSGKVTDQKIIDSLGCHKVTVGFVKIVEDGSMDFVDIEYHESGSSNYLKRKNAVKKILEKEFKLDCKTEKGSLALKCEGEVKTARAKELGMLFANVKGLDLATSKCIEHGINHIFEEIKNVYAKTSDYSSPFINSDGTGTNWADEHCFPVGGKKGGKS